MPSEVTRDDLGDRLNAATEALRRVLTARSTLAAVAGRWHGSGAALGADAYAKDLDPILREDPENPVANLYRAIAVLLPSKQTEAAKALLERVLVQARVPRRFELWIFPYAKAHLGVVALQEGRVADGKRLVAEALTAMPGSTELRELTEPYRGQFRR